MKKRTKLKDRELPNYYRDEEVMNMVTHIAGGTIAIIALVLCILKPAMQGNLPGVITGSIFGLSMIGLYAISSIYHGLINATGKKVLQILDHCAIYLLIAGTYTPILLCAIRPQYPVLGWGLLTLQWGLGILAATLTAIDLRKYRAFSMVCYIFMGWCIIFFYPIAVATLTKPGFAFMLAGGISYTVGAILFGIGTKVRWMHSVFHIFVVAGSVLQFIPIFLYVI